jgi:hypothetical protein
LRGVDDLTVAAGAQAISFPAAPAILGDSIMNLNISRDWLLRMADKEANGIISVGGLVSMIDSCVITQNVTTSISGGVTEFSDDLGGVAERET